jgi:predicted nucleic acid-binding protein
MTIQQKIVTSDVTMTTATPIILDCCTIVSAIQGKPGAREFKEKLARRKDLTLLVPDVVISEVAKIARLSAEAAEKAISSFSQGNNRIVRLEDDQKTLADAVLLSIRYDYCHYPDSIYLIHARNAGGVLVTYDRKLRDVARMEGIMACSPDNFRFYQ